MRQHVLECHIDRLKIGAGLVSRTKAPQWAMTEQPRPTPREFAGAVKLVSIELANVIRRERGIFGENGVHDHQTQAGQVDCVRLGRVVALLPWARVEKTEPTRPGAGTVLVIATYEDERRGSEYRRRWLEPVGLPRSPSLPGPSDWATCAALVPCGARLLPI